MSDPNTPISRDDRHRLICTRPFRWFEVSRGMEEGEVFFCCPSWLSTPIGNLTRQSVEEVWNSDIAQDIRRSMLDGSFEYCDHARCPFLQRIDGPVQRVSEVEDPELRQIIANGITRLPHGPREINCSYDRSCNLSCPSCRTGLIVETANAERILGIQRKLNDEALKDAVMLYITGSGDPFGSPHFRHWLRTMRRRDMPLLEKIHLHTNGQLWNRRMWNSLSPDARELVRSADISIDAAEAETYAVNRRGGDFRRLLRNLEFVAELRAAGPLRWLGLNMTVQANNFEQMAAFVALGDRYGADTVAFHQLVNWGTFSDEEYAARAVHLPRHPRYQEFLRRLADPVFDSERVSLSNLSDLRTAVVGR